MFARRGLFLSTLALAATALLFVAHDAEAAQDAVLGNALNAISIVAALIAVGVAVYAMRRADQVRGDFQRFSRSVETVLNDVASRSNRDSATIGELNRMVADEIRGMTSRNATIQQAQSQHADADIQRPRPMRIDAPQLAPQPVAAVEAFDQVLTEAVANNRLDISLQPIISVSRSTAVGFEVHAHVAAGDHGAALDIRRLANEAPDLDPAAFERTVLRQAIETGRRQLGSTSEKMPFHIAISPALLGDKTEMDNLAELTSQHRALAKSIVLSLAGETFNAGGSVRENLDKLTMEGFPLSVEDWVGDAKDAAAAASRGVRSVKITVDRLLNLEGTSDRDIIAALNDAGIQIIATGVGRDEDAVSLIDLGVDLMEGDRFSGPRLIKSPASARRTEFAET